MQFRASGPQGEDLGKAEGSFTHRSPPEPASIRVPAAGAGVYEVEVDSPRWYGWSEPSMPTVLAGAPVAGGGARFSLMLALGRHWFFGVPEGTEEFLVRVELADPNHALQVEINAPDRIVQVLYAQGGAPREVKVPVPDGLGEARSGSSGCRPAAPPGFSARARATGARYRSIPTSSCTGCRGTWPPPGSSGSTPARGTAEPDAPGTGGAPLHPGFANPSLRRATAFGLPAASFRRWNGSLRCGARARRRLEIAGYPASCSGRSGRRAPGSAAGRARGANPPSKEERSRPDQVRPGHRTAVGRPAPQAGGRHPIVADLSDGRVLRHQFVQVLYPAVPPGHR